MASSKVSLTEFNRQVNIAIPYAVDNAEHLGISKTVLDSLQKHLADWQKLWAITQNKKKRNTMSVDQMHTLHTVFDKEYRALQQSLKHSIEVVLTDDDYNNLFITKPGVSHKNPPIKEIPMVHVTGRRPRELDLEISENELPGFDGKGLIENADLVGVKWCVRDASDPAPTDEEYNQFETFKRANMTLTFTTEQERKVVYIKAAYGNTHGLGAFSDPISVVIPD